MGILRKVWNKRAAAFALLVCLLTLGLFQTANAAPASANVTFTVDQAFSQPAASSAADTFTYELRPLAASNPMPAGSAGGTYTFSISGNGSASIGPMSYTSTGTYGYELRQAPASLQGYTYDGEVYTVQVYVTSATRADVVIYRSDGSKSSDAKFTNVYKPLASDPSLMVDPPVQKTVAGTPSKDGTFVFKLEAGNKSNPMPAGSKDGVKTMTIVGSGSEDFGTWSYTEAGVYYYSISEVNVGEDGYAYDTGVYTITDNVQDVAGQLVLTRTVTNDANKPVTSCGFINQYTAPVGGTIDNGTGPKTGDGSLTELYTAAFAAGCAGCIVCVLILVYRKRRKRQPGMGA